MSSADDKAVDTQSAAKSLQASEDPRLTEAMEEFLTELEAGKNPSREDFLARYSDIASDLAVCRACGTKYPATQRRRAYQGGGLQFRPLLALSTG